MTDFKSYLKAAKQGDSDAQCELGLCYEYSDGVARDYVEAARWYREAAEQGHPEAQYRLGDCYDWGHGVARDDVEAVKWYRKAAEEGHIEAQLQLANFYRTGCGVKQDDVEAAKWYRKAAEQGGYYPGMCQLAECYAYGRGVERNGAEAAWWYREAADQGHFEAPYELAKCYHYGKGVEQNIAEAIKWYRKAADMGHFNAPYELAECYCYGNGVEQDRVEAVKWYHKAADMGHFEASYELARCYYYGSGVEQDRTEAIKWYRQAFMCKERLKLQAKLEADRRNFWRWIEPSRRRSQFILETHRQDFQQQKDCRNFQLELEKCRQEFQTYLENNRQKFHLEVNKSNTELQRELSAQTIQAEDTRFLVDSKKTILHELRLIYALTVKYYISAEQYLHYLDESIRAWVDLRTDKSAEEFLQELADNNGEEVGKYFSYEDKRYFIKLCDAYYENEQKSKLGNICLRLSVYVNGKAAMRYYREAAEQGDIYAQDMLGNCYYCYGTNTKDYAEAIEWYRLAAEGGRPGAAEAKANAVEQKLKEREECQKADEALAALHKVAEQGDAEAQFELGELYYKSGAYVESINWYSKAAEQVHAGAQYVLGG